jgi:hypothetical protein
MIDIKQAFEILDTYLFHEINLDPMSSQKLVSNKKLYKEYDLYWHLHDCSLKYEFEEMLDDRIGTGGFYIDKQNGEMYQIGSYNPWFTEEEFRNFKEGKPTLIQWKESKCHHLLATLNNKMLFEEEVILFDTSYQKRDEDLESIVRDNFNDIEQYKSIRIQYKVAGVNPSKLIIYLPKTNQLETNIEYVSLNMEYGFSYYSDRIFHLKKWVRINNRKLTDNIWIELAIDSINKDFVEWDLTLNLEIL